MNVLLIVTHLLGTGHLSRALTLGRAFAQSGHTVMVVSGGMPAPQLDSSGLTLLGLPPLRSDGTDFTRLLTEDGQVADETYLVARRAALVEAVRTFQPNVLITELYPFGRRILADEFTAALNAAQDLPHQPIVLSSIRDILAPPSKPAKVQRADDIIETYYDGVLVHADESVTPLSVSWPVSDRLAPHLYYTGYVAPEPPTPHPGKPGEGEILVSSGGGAVGQPIFRAAIEAARKMPNRRWRLLVGGRDAQDRMSELSEKARGTSVAIEGVRPDFRQMLQHAAASVSMCGYNTALDLLQSGTPAVLVPFEDGKEVEQSLRGKSLSELSAMEVLANRDLSGAALADALLRVMSDGPRTPLGYRFDGARRSVEIAEQLWNTRA
ncbi:MAG: glycosyltransferase [Pseudomonadota bacterium]